jgi:hypothetical protein
MTGGHNGDAGSGAGPSSATRLVIDQALRPSEVGKLVFTEQVLNTEPFTAVVTSARPLPSDKLVPGDFRIVREHVRSDGYEAYAVGERGSLGCDVTDHMTVVWISAPSRTGLEELLHELRAVLPEDEEDAGTVRVSLWRSSKRAGPASMSRSIEAPRWADVARNYPTSVRGHLAPLIHAEASTTRGRLILWHGEPGTGKTSAVLALLREWAGWCDGQIITDPERMFEDAEYLLDVLMAGDVRWYLRRRDRTPRWKLIVAEDTDEYLRSDARRQSGPALGRLLNATDGILARGLPTIVLLTTNDEVGRLHPAVTRPGRCMTVTEFKRFSASEAREWLGQAHDVPAHGASLAELFHIRDGQASPGVTPAEPLSGGNYL